MQVSKLPPAKDNSYPDCYFTATIELRTISAGASVPRKMILVLPGFFSRQYAPEANFKVGDKVRATVVPFASMPESVRQVQQADETEDVDLEFFFPQKITRIEEFQEGASLPFAEKRQKADPVQIHPVDQKAKEARQESIRKDLEAINKLLAQHEGNWEKWFASLKDFRERYKKQFEAKAQRWIGDSFFSAGELATGGVYKPEFVQSLVSFKNYLAARNVDLIVVRIPNKGEIVDDLFTEAPKDQVTNPYLLRLYKELLEADVEVITGIIPRAKEKRLGFPLMYWYQDFAEVHPAEGMAWVIAEEFARRVGRYESIRTAPKQALSLKQSPKNGPIVEGWQNLTWPAGNPKFDPKEKVRYASVLDRDNKPLELKKGSDSPVLLLGSSFVAAPSLPNSATIPHYFAYLSGIIPDLVQRRDGDFMMPRSIAREGDAFLQKRTVCLFPFVPWVAFNALAPLPIFDPDKSVKTPVAEYSGRSLPEVVQAVAGTPEGAFSYASDGTLEIQPHIKNVDSAVSVRVKLPKEMANFPYFMVTVQFSSKDFAKVSAQYAGQSDVIRRNGAEQSLETFTFATKTDQAVTFEFTPDSKRKAPARIERISFIGVKQPVYYGSQGTSR